MGEKEQAALEQRRRRAAAVVDILEKKYPDALCSLTYRKDYELLIAVRLSAQCTDARVNIVTQTLFERYPTLESFAEADPGELEQAVRPCGFYKVKAADIRKSCRLLLERHGRHVPGTMEELLALPGVGRKTANLLLGDLFHQPGAVVADTHCIRIAGRLGLVDSADPAKVEQQLREVVAPDKSNDLCHRLVLFGREVCKARKPDCGNCPIAKLCPYEKEAGAPAKKTP